MYCKCNSYRTGKMDIETKCQICLTEASGNTKFYHHYGAICCYSCKAFFRRCCRGETVQKQCKNGGVCQLNKGRKTCKECRFQKCLAVGMEPEKLLYGEDRKKYSHPKKKRKICNSNAAGEPSRANTNPDDDEDLVTVTPKKVRIDSSLLIDNIQKYFTESISEYHHCKSDINLLVNGHLDPSRWSSRHSRAFVRVMESYVPLMKHFAYKSPSFLSLDAADRVRLLQNNSILFREYIMTRYLSSQAGMDQLEWILGLYESVGILDYENIQPVDFDLINHEGVLMSNWNASSISNFKYYLSVIKQYFQYPHYHTALICNFLLFNTQHWNPEDVKDIKDAKQIGEFEEEARHFIKYGCDLEISSMIGISYLDQLIQTLFAMTSLKNLKVMPVVQKVENRCFAQHESQWVKYAASLLQESIFAFPGDSNYVEMCLAFQSGAFHLSHQYLFQSNALATKRLDYFFKKAFGISTSIDPVILARSNLIVLAYAGRLTKLSESIRIFTGIKHHGELESRIGNKVNKPWILNRGIRKLIDYKELREYERVFRSVSSFVHDFEIAMLTLMDSLFMGSTEHAELSIALRRLVLKKIAESCVLETRKHPYDIYQQFLLDAQTMGAIQHKVVMLAIMNPKTENKT